MIERFKRWLRQFDKYTYTKHGKYDPDGMLVEYHTVTAVAGNDGFEGEYDIKKCMNDYITSDNTITVPTNEIRKIKLEDDNGIFYRMFVNIDDDISFMDMDTYGKNYQPFGKVKILKKNIQ